MAVVGCRHRGGEGRGEGRGWKGGVCVETPHTGVGRGGGKDGGGGGGGGRGGGRGVNSSV